ncbi:transcriptional regulatory protein c terminal [Lucifera butyrica]|uniref:Transcriptional regulatory protein KdpE n=1 Tax=Lucifera butyrica TaxID=1351585 RepID=A0A498R828_9FIRM|nr:response regulator [Lucifera butyrica]VBB07067.1 transcriptional regulatory protein c terminal [Lucifera butyrica]
MDQQLKVLVIDDELQLRRLLKVSLEGQGYKLSEAVNGQDGLLAAAAYKPDIVLLDLGLPDMDGKEVVRRIREWSRVPILILSARDQEQEKVEALDAGADDYLTKPFGISELMARIRVSLRHASPGSDDSRLECGDLIIDLTKREVTLSGKEVKLTPTEYDLLKVLAQNAGKVLTHRQLLKLVWGVESDDNQYIRVYIGQLRRKIEENPAQPRYITTESGIGYRMMHK